MRDSPVAMPSLIRPHATILPTYPAAGAARVETAGQPAKKPPRGRRSCLQQVAARGAAAAAAESAGVQRTPKAVARAGGPRRARQVLRLGRACDCEPVTVSGHVRLVVAAAAGHGAAAGRSGAHWDGRWALARTVRLRVRERYETKRSWQGRRQRRDGMVSTCTCGCCAIESAVSRILRYG